MFVFVIESNFKLIAKWMFRICGKVELCFILVLLASRYRDFHRIYVLSLLAARCRKCFVILILTLLAAKGSGFTICLEAKSREFIGYLSYLCWQSVVGDSLDIRDLSVAKAHLEIDGQKCLSTSPRRLADLPINLSRFRWFFSLRSFEETKLSRFKFWVCNTQSVVYSK